MENNSINIVSNFINIQIIIMKLNIYLRSINKTKLIVAFLSTLFACQCLFISLVACQIFIYKSEIGTLFFETWNWIFFLQNMKKISSINTNLHSKYIHKVILYTQYSMCPQCIFVKSIQFHCFQYIRIYDVGSFSLTQVLRNKKS